MFLIPHDWYVIKKTGKHGRGAFAARDIEPGTIIGDYLGILIKSSSNDENKTGLYDMCGGEKYDILANPKDDGIHLINHACANNCDMYPYRGHILYFAIRKIFKGEEITVNYGLGPSEEKNIACALHACHCSSEICTGTMHESDAAFEEWYEPWEKLVKKNFGVAYRKLPGNYGDKLAPLDQYPPLIKADNPKIYPNIFGAEKKTPVSCPDKTLPTLSEIRKKIGQTGRQLLFPNLGIRIYGIRDGMLLVKK